MAKIPRVLFPAADPPLEFTLDAVAEPFVSQAYVYLLRVVELVGAEPNAKIPLVEFPAAAPLHEPVLDAVADPLVSVANVYLLRIAEGLHVLPSAKIPTVPSAPPSTRVNPKAFAENAPLVMTAGMSGSLKLRLGSVDVIRCACCFDNCVSVNIHAARIAGCGSRAALPLRRDRHAINRHSGIVIRRSALRD